MFRSINVLFGVIILLIVGAVLAASLIYGTGFDTGFLILMGFFVVGSIIIILWGGKK